MSERGRLPPIVVGLNVVLVFLAGFQYPYFRSDGVNVILAVLLLLNVAARTRARKIFEILDAAIARSEAVKNLLVAVSSVIVLIGGLEILGQFLSRTGIVEPYNAMKTMVLTGAEDFRMAHITADRYRIPDPVLLWRPVDRWPYNSQRLKGGEAEIPKPAGTFRIMTYGDSNTDGPEERSWPEQLGELLEPRQGAAGVDFEVLNAGVAGYSSYQGSMRFRSQVERFQPDLITVSFGYNDIAPALGMPDREFRLPPAALVSLQRQLLRFRFYRVAEKLARGWTPEELPETGPRVPIEDYFANLESFLATGREHGVGVVLLTRPHQPGPRELELVTDNWRGRIPEYNRGVLEVARRQRAPVIDVQRYFEPAPELFYDDCHFTEEGHATMAAMLLRELSAAGLLPPPPSDSL
ncbi:MAG: hypothetical protein GY719_02275 [bacterium]|nr:hypothetical protein [bacterium]